MLPGFNGVEVCRRIRQFSHAYVLMLTARGEEMDKVVVHLEASRRCSSSS